VVKETGLTTSEPGGYIGCNGTKIAGEEIETLTACDKLKYRNGILASET